MNTRRFSLTAEVSTMQHPAAQPRGATMIVNTRTGQGPAPCTNGVDCPEPVAKVATQPNITVNVHFHDGQEVVAIRTANGTRRWQWVTLGTVTVFVDNEQAARSIAAAFNQLADYERDSLITTEPF